MKLWVVGILLALLGVIALVGVWEVDVEKIGPLDLSLEEKATLLELARATLRDELAGEGAPAVDESNLSANLKAEAACFVTLNKDGRLRGCMLDSFMPHEPIYKNVMRNVMLAATNDPRFPPVSVDELESIKIEISVLGSSYAIGFESPEELLASLRPGIDGVILTTSFGSSTYLPQVWEQLPDSDVFLTELCRKHGAPGDCWKMDDLLRVEVYQVNHFGESEFSEVEADGD